MAEPSPASMAVPSPSPMAAASPANVASASTPAPTSVPPPTTSGIPLPPNNVFEDQKKVELIIGMNPKKYAEIKKVSRALPFRLPILCGV